MLSSWLVASAGGHPSVALLREEAAAPTGRRCVVLVRARARARIRGRVRIRVRVGSGLGLGWFVVRRRRHMGGSHGARGAWPRSALRTARARLAPGWLSRYRARDKTRLVRWLPPQLPCASGARAACRGLARAAPRTYSAEAPGAGTCQLSELRARRRRRRPYPTCLVRVRVRVRVGVRVGVGVGIGFG